MSNENVTNTEPEVEPEDANEEVTEFLPDEPHPDTPQSVLEEQGIEDRAYEGKADDDAAEKDLGETAGTKDAAKDARAS